MSTQPGQAESVISPFDGKGHEPPARLTRLRALAELLARQTETERLLQALLDQLRQSTHSQSDIEDETRRQRRVALAALDLFLAPMREPEYVTRHPEPRMLARDLREASRLCLAEARATVDFDTRRALAARAFDLAMMGEAAARI